MSAITRWFLLMLGALILGTALFLISWDIPAPTARIEQTLPDDRFPR